MTDVKTPEELSAEATNLYKRGEFEPAAGAFRAAALGYTARGDALMAAEMKNNQSVAHLQADNAQGALESAEGTDAVFASAGDLRRQGMALANVAAALDALKRKNEAIEKYRQAADILEKAGEGDLRSYVLKALSVIELRKGKPLDAMVAMQDGLAGAKKPTLGQKILRKILGFRPW